jgi:hypothetical protein
MLFRYSLYVKLQFTSLSAAWTKPFSHLLISWAEPLFARFPFDMVCLQKTI